MADAEHELGLGEEEEEDKPEPRIFKPDLYEAAKANDTQKVFDLLEENVPPTHVDEGSGWTPLHWAANYGNVQMTHLLIEFGATAPYQRMVARAKRAKAKAEAEAAAAAKKESGGAFEEAAVANPEEEGEAADETADAKTMDAENKETAPDTEGGETKTEATADNKGGKEEKKEGGEGEKTDGTAQAETKEGEAKVEDKTDTGAEERKEEVAADADEFDEEDEDDLDYETAMDRKAETSVDLTKNTPLLWASAKGHLRVMWLLLMSGYSPNDLDDIENNCLHLAASGGVARACRVLIDSGAKSTLVNMYKNLPIDMAVNADIREIIADAMVKGASMTEADIEAKHVSNMEKYMEMTNKLENIIKKAEKPLGPEGGSESDVPEMIASLMETLSESRAWGLDPDVITSGEDIVKKLEMSQDLLAELKLVQDNLPIRTQDQFSKFVSRLEGAVADAKVLELEEGLIHHSERLVKRCGLEYFLSVLTERLKDVECAVDIHEHDMKRLEQALQKAIAEDASEEIVGVADSLHRRLNSELGMSRALAKMPEYRLPKKEGEEVPDGYWQPEDTGHIDETTEGFPHPIAETGEYIWVPAECFTKLQDAIDAIKTNYDGAEEMGANADIVAQAKTMLAKAEKDMKLLAVKNEADKAHGIEAAHKLMKKHSKGKKKK